MVDDLREILKPSNHAVTLTLESHFNKGKYFIPLGNNTLVSVNAYKPISNNDYTQTGPYLLANQITEYINTIPMRLPPAVLISGVTNSGKSVFFKQFFFLLTQKNEKFFYLHLALEPITNAMTLQNINTTRLMKLTKIYFDNKFVINSQCVTDYFLFDTFRITQPKSSEMNFYAFYYFILGATPEILKILFLEQDATIYNYLKTNISEDLKIDYELHMKIWMTACQKAEYTPSEITSVFEILAAILLLGNIEFMVPVQSTEIKPLRNISTLLGLINPANLLFSLTHITFIQKSGSQVVNDLNLEQSSKIRHTLARGLYIKLVQWMIFKINEKSNSKHVTMATLSIIDIPGFVSVAKNNLEELLINFSYEKIHNFTLQKQIKDKQRELANENVINLQLEIQDNWNICHLLSENFKGLLAIIDNVCCEQSVDARLILSRLSLGPGKSQLYEAGMNLGVREASSCFLIKHHLTAVTYDVINFKERISDRLTRDLEKLLGEASNDILSTTFKLDKENSLLEKLQTSPNRPYVNIAIIPDSSPQKLDMNTEPTNPENKLTSTPKPSTTSPLAKRSTTPTTPDVKYVSSPQKTINSPRPTIPSRGSRQLNTPILGNKEPISTGDKLSPSKMSPLVVRKPIKSRIRHTREFVNRIINELQTSHLFTVNCIVPNYTGNPNYFDKTCVETQVKHFNLTPQIKLSRFSFDQSITYAKFLSRYGSLLGYTKDEDNPLETCQKLLSVLGISSKSYQLAKTKIFIKDSEMLTILESVKNASLSESALVIQSYFLAWQARVQFKRLRHAQIIIANYWKTHVERENFLKMRSAVNIISWYVRRYLSRKQKQKIRSDKINSNAVTIIAKYFRRYMIFRKFRYKLRRPAGELVSRFFLNKFRYEFLINLANNLPPKSPVRFDWPKPPQIFLKKTSDILFKIYHQWKCRNFRRILKLNPERYQLLKEKLIANNVFRKRKFLYPKSISQIFIGDHLNLEGNPKWRKISSQTGGYAPIVWSSTVLKVNRANGKFQDRFLVVTRQDIMILESPLKLVQHFPLHALTRISTSPYNDGCFVLHVNFQAETQKNPLGSKGDSIFVSEKVIEFTAKTLLAIKELTNDYINVSVLSEIETHSREGDVVIIEFLYTRGSQYVEQPKRQGNRLIFTL